jgi:hypothetical protein
MISVTRALSKALLDTGPFKTVMDDCVLEIYSGTVPTNADGSLPDAEAAIGSAVKLIRYTDNGAVDQYLTWEAAAVFNVISKLASQVWKGTTLANGTATFFRYILPADVNGASTTALRIQGTVGTAFGDLLLSTITFTTSEERVINNAYVALV